MMQLVCSQSGQLEVTQTYARDSQRDHKTLTPLTAPITLFHVPHPACMLV